jgi:hypothetical protein
MVTVNTPNDVVASLARNFGCKHESLPFTYLGYPLEQPDQELRISYLLLKELIEGSLVSPLFLIMGQGWL